MSGLFATLVSAALALAPLQESKDILCLKDGRIVQGKPMARVEGGIEITYKNGKVLVPSDLILDAVLDADAKAPPLTDEEKAQAAKGFVRFENKWVTPKQRDDIVAKRVAKHRVELEELRNHGEWRNRRTEKSRYFQFEYTVPQRIYEPYRDAMEAYFADFLKAWKIKAPKADEPLAVCFYADAKSFYQIGGVGKGVLGYFDPANRHLNIFYDRLDPARTEDTMFHEANHYLQSLIDPLFHMPHFPGESLAEYYGASEWDPQTRKFTVGLIQEPRLCEIQSDIAAGERMDLHKLITTDGMYEHYTWGWALVHFLMNDPRYAAKFQRFFLSLSDAKKVLRVDVGGGKETMKQEDVLPVFMRELGLKDATGLRKLQVEWHDYIDAKLDFVSIAGIERAALKAKRDGRTIRATRLLKEAIAKKTKNPIVHHTLAEIYAEDGKLVDAEAEWKRASELDPLNGLFYSRLAFYIAPKRKADAIRLQGLAAELGEDDFWVYLDLEGEKPEPGKEQPPDGSGPKKPKPPGGG